MRSQLDRSRSLHTRGRVALAAASAPALFVTVALTGSGGRWSPLFTWMALGAAILALLSVICGWLADRTHPTRSPQGDSPQVTHPGVTPVSTAPEVRK